jgi:LysM repeat protein
MEKSSSAAARSLAAIALICGVLVLLVVVVSSLGGDSGDGGPHRSGVTRTGGEHAKKHRAPAVYVVENGDTLTSIAHETGVPVVRIQQLNPEIDPQVLVSGEKLKLR